MKTTTELQSKNVLHTRTAAVFLVLAFLTSCSSSLGLTLHNNSDATLRVSALGVDVVIEPRTSKTFEIIGYFFVSHDGTDHHYRQPLVPGDYYERHRIFRSKINVQFEPSAQLILVKPGESFPVSFDISQPEGFPLTPKNVQSNNVPLLPRYPQEQSSRHKLRSS